MARAIVGVAAGLVAFTLGMMLARLCLGVLASLGAGVVCAWITRGSRRAVMVLAGILLGVFIPVHYGLWDKFPLWYHLVFLLSLVAVTPLGARVFRPSAAA